MSGFELALNELKILIHLAEKGRTNRIRTATRNGIESSSCTSDLPDLRRHRLSKNLPPRYDTIEQLTVESKSRSVTPVDFLPNYNEFVTSCSSASQQQPIVLNRQTTISSVQIENEAFTTDSSISPPTPSTPLASQSLFQAQEDTRSPV